LAPDVAGIALLSRLSQAQIPFHFQLQLSSSDPRTYGDEAAALSLFWELLDEYRALEAQVDGAVLPDSG